MQSMLFFYLVLLAPLTISAAAGDHGVLDVEDTNKVMNEAITKARSTVDLFFSRYTTMESDGYSIKVAMETTEGGLEHIWFTPISIDGDQVTARCANDPRGIPNLKLGDIRTFPKDQVSDWMIIVGKTCYGGYTIRAMNQIHPERALQMDFAELEE